MGAMEEARALALVAEYRAAEGTKNAVTAGAVALARLIIQAERDNHLAAELSGFVVMVGGARQVERMIAGTLLPCQAWGEDLGRMTGGEIVSATFLRPWDGELPEINQAAPPDPEPPHTPAGGALAEIPGRLGEVPSGPLFTSVVDPAAQGRFVVMGMGLALVLDENSGFALREAVIGGLMDLAQSRQAVQHRQAA